jgi:secreted PhoX family phosphatase
MAQQLLITHVTKGLHVNEVQQGRRFGWLLEINEHMRFLAWHKGRVVAASATMLVNANGVVLQFATDDDDRAIHLDHRY